MPLVERRPKHKERAHNVTTAIVKAMKDVSGPILIASDGSSQDSQAAGWGFAIGKADYRPGKAYNGCVTGADQSSWAGQMEAMTMAVMCASAAQVDVTLLIDNSSALNGLCDLIEDRFTLPKFGFGRWSKLIPHLVGRNHCAYWVPSHDKKASWKPPVTDFGDAKVWRELNDSADVQAGKGKDSMLEFYKHEQHQPQMDVAFDWADDIMAKLYQHVVDYIEADDVIKGNFDVHVDGFN